METNPRGSSGRNIRGRQNLERVRRRALMHHANGNAHHKSASWHFEGYSPSKIVTFNFLMIATNDSHLQYFHTNGCKQMCLYSFLKQELKGLRHHFILLVRDTCLSSEYSDKQAPP